MARNWIQFQKGYSLTQFVDEYGTDEQSMGALLVGVGRTGSCAPDASIPGTGALKAVPCISVATVGIRSR